MPTCFVIMGFGKKTDPASGREFDLDRSYRNVIKPAIIAAGYECVRADEILHSGEIDVPMYDMLYSADLVVADLSTSNLNAIFELGVRHALKPRATIIIAESGFKIPFDVTHIIIQHYTHLGPDIGFDEVMRMRSVLENLARALQTSDAVDSPIYTVLHDLEKPTRRSGAGTPSLSPAIQSNILEPDTYAAKTEFARQAIAKDAFALAESILEDIYRDQTKPGADGAQRPARPGIVQQLALATYKAGEQAAKTEGPQRALGGYAKAGDLLRTLDVETTTDPETLGLSSAIHKRKAETESLPMDERRRDLDGAIRAAERGFRIRRDYYNGTNLAYLYTLRAALSSGEDRIADTVFARRVRQDVVGIAERRRDELAGKVSASGTALQEEAYWIAATRAESLVALGDPAADEALRTALARAPEGWMAATTRAQVERLKLLLAPSAP
ncbi:MAG: tetratricopeptide repeat-containing protein [Roseiarcus sp.]